MLHSPSNLAVNHSIPVTLEAKNSPLFIQKETASIVTVYSRSINLEKTAITARSIGIIIDATGLIITSSIDNPQNQTLVVALADKEYEVATILGNIPEIDLTLLQLNRLPKNIPTATIDKSITLSIGDTIQIINANEKRYQGKVKGKTAIKNIQLHGRIIHYLNIETIEKHTHLTGPLFNANEELIGWSSEKLSTGGNGKIGFAIGMDTIQDIITEKTA